MVSRCDQILSHVGIFSIHPRYQQSHSLSAGTQDGTKLSLRPSAENQQAQRNAGIWPRKEELFPPGCLFGGKYWLGELYYVTRYLERKRKANSTIWVPFRSLPWVSCNLTIVTIPWVWAHFIDGKTQAQRVEWLAHSTVQVPLAPEPHVCFQVPSQKGNHCGDEA